MRFETAPGRQAQVDWATVTAAIGGHRRRVHMFAMVLWGIRAASTLPSPTDLPPLNHS